MAKKLWAVTVEDEIVVFAETREEALSVANEVSRLDLEGLQATSAYPVDSARGLPSGWEEDFVPIGSDDFTIGEILEGRAQQEG